MYQKKVLADIRANKSYLKAFQKLFRKLSKAPTKNPGMKMRQIQARPSATQWGRFWRPHPVCPHPPPSPPHPTFQRLGELGF